MNHTTEKKVVTTTIFYRLDGELGSITVPLSDSTGEMKRLARCGAIVRGIVRDYDSQSVENAVLDGVLSDIAKTDRDDSGHVQPSEIEQAAFDSANVADRWDGGVL